MYVIPFIIECKIGPLGMASGDIPDSSINASSYQNPSTKFPRKPEFARLGFNFPDETVGGIHYPPVRYWGNDASDKNPWIQVDLGSNSTVTGLQTEGNKGKHLWEYWVQQVKVQIGTAPENLSFIDDGSGASNMSKVDSLGNSVESFKLYMDTLFLNIYTPLVHAHGKLSFNNERRDITILVGRPLSIRADMSLTLC